MATRTVPEDQRQPKGRRPKGLLALAVALGPTSAWARGAAFALTVGLVFFFHLWQLGAVPRGLYVDESSIGINAASIVETGRDEHGVAFPLYFRAFGEYKSPVYIYTTALVFKLFGVSEFTLRLTSALFFLLFLIAFTWLVWELCGKSSLVALYALTAAGLLPWFFNLSRIAFEVISHLSAVAWALLVTWKAYRRDDARGNVILALLAGGLWGLSLYTYPTARVLAPLTMVALLAVYHTRKQWARTGTAFLGFVVCAVPLLIASTNNPEVINARFRYVTYIFDASLSLAERIETFGSNYALYVSPRYLLRQGDTILRHHTGSTGELYFIVGALAVLGLLSLTMTSAPYRSRFIMFLGLNALAAPVAAALTTGDSSLRSILIGLYALVFSAIGASFLQSIADERARRVLLALVFLFLGIEASSYLSDYFTRYPERSILWFESYDFKSALAIALQQGPKEIVVSEKANQPYAHLAFYRRVLRDPGTVPAFVGPPVAEEGRCVIYFLFDETVFNQERFRWRDLTPEGGFTKLRCYDERIP